MSILSRLFGGGGGKPAAEPEIYKGFNVFPEPIKEAGGYRVAARIEKEIDGEVKTHQLIRADVCQSETDAQEISANKAKILIDEKGDGVFG
ncbi:HlyU family transcriptional regulator [Tropicimonas sp. TH_r6]|uniref:HlyU family transcriptional regulator n=1 Tax=Tropicimonas sp. TH_r6 TaxID=3082085 RepID=UPI0029547ED6|nr:HlyU family transcriptional regulator [Tropicimonas sp. TH_r6]MDV7145011.1 HlyU family transcriptional regulator [Tropicimonas sp. TH_r6]